jgi:hypothetical protein
MGWRREATRRRILYGVATRGDGWLREATRGDARRREATRGDASSYLIWGGDARRRVVVSDMGWRREATRRRILCEATRGDASSYLKWYGPERTVAQNGHAGEGGVAPNKQVPYYC